MALFAVTRTGTSVRLVIDAASLVAEEGMLVFQTAEGDPLMMFAAEDVLHVETVNAPQRPLHSVFVGNGDTSSGR